VQDSPLEAVARLVMVLALLLAAARMGAEVVGRFLAGQIEPGSFARAVEFDRWPGAGAGRGNGGSL